MIKKNKTIAVLMGGWNPEREVSLRSGEAVYQSLIKQGYEAHKIDFSRNVVDEIKEIKPDIVFNALHGTYGEDGCVQGLLEILDIKYTHSKLLPSAICMDKIKTARFCEQIDGVFVPKSAILKKENSDNKKIISQIGKSFVIKPINQGSSVGVEVILDGKEFDIDKYSWQYGDEIIIEKYIAGQEVQVAIMNNKALGAIEVRPKKLFYDYECKYTPGMTEYIMPAEISAEKYLQLLSVAEKIHIGIGCRGISRIDFILNNKDNGDNNFYLLEVNTHPGFTATSLVPKIAKHAGIEFDEIVQFLLKDI